MAARDLLDEQTTPVGLALTDVWTSVPAVSFSGLDLYANRVEGNVSWTPPVNPDNYNWTTSNYNWTTNFPAW